MSASFPSSSWAQFARAVRATPAAVAPNAVHAALPTSATPFLAPSLASPVLPTVLPNLPTVSAQAAAPHALPLPLAGEGGSAFARPFAPSSEPSPRETPLSRLRGLSVARDVAPLWTGGVARRAAGAVWAGRSAATPSLLGRPTSPASAAKAELPADGPVVIPPQTLRRRVADALHYLKITGDSLYWYTFPRLIERWEEVAEGTGKGRERAVRHIKGFFIAHRVLGSTGSYAPMGFRVATNRTVILDAWRIYIRYFPDDPGSAESFARLVARATLYNPNRRSTQFRKVIFHALREAAVLPPDRVAPYFDSLVTKDKSAELAAYQAVRQGEVLALFDETVKKTILELNAGLPAGNRVVGAVLLGSFANGAAGPGSDLDVQALSEDGGTTYNVEFLKRLKARWKAEGDPTHPASGFEYALPLSKELLLRVHREAYLVLSPYPEVVATMSTPAEERRALDKARTKGGLAFVLFYSALLFGVLSAYEAWRLIRPK